ncbi:MAG: O-antigen ligase family protein [Nitrospira sp.]|nr:O-antigen ligase family protein [Nitrospira sp.]
MSDSRSGTEPIGTASLPHPLHVAFVSMGITCLAWMVFLAAGEEGITKLTLFSSKLKVLQGNDGLVIALIGISVVCVGGSAAVLPFRPRLLMALILLSFGLAEVVIPWLNLGAFMIRYLVVITLTAGGVLALFHTKRTEIGWLRWVALAFLGWCFASVAVTGARTESLVLLPIQLVLVVGMLFGARGIYHSPPLIIQAANVFAGIAVVMTGIHLMALLALPDSFLKGRFTSIFPLPTSFGNNYVFFMGAMLWRMFHGGKMIEGAILASCSAIGGVMLLLSGTRNAFLMVAIMVLVYFFVWKARVTAIAGVSVLITALVATGFLLESSMFKQATHRANSKESLEIREQVWGVAWEYIKERPLVGYGLGTSAETLAKSLPSWKRFNAHNAYLGIWLQLGVIGLVGVVLMYLGAMAIGWKILMGSAVPKDLVVAVALPLATLTGLFVGGMFEENLSNRGGLQQVIWGLDICLIQSVRAQLRAMKPGIVSDDQVGTLSPAALGDL